MKTIIKILIAAAVINAAVVSSNIGPIPFSNGAGYRNPRVD
jgi:hypothetical protein